MAEALFTYKFTGDWSRVDKRRVQPAIQDSIELLALASEDLGLNPTLPKVGEYYRVGRQHGFSGLSLDAEKFKVGLPANKVKQGQIKSGDPQLLKVAGHEFIHCLRRERVIGNGILEFAATEALAHIGEDILTRSVYGANMPTDYHQVDLHDFDQSTQARLVGMLYDDRARQSAEFSEDDNGIDPYHLKWFGYDEGAFTLAPGVVVGMRSLSALLSDGMTLSDAIFLPPEEIVRI